MTEERMALIELVETQADGEIARALDLAPSVVQRLLNSLLGKHYLQQDATSRTNMAPVWARTTSCRGVRRTMISAHPPSRWSGGTALPAKRFC
ncbi:helix-turn-helix domain-containing protein [Tropicimonas isoalkanivorans]|uniref:IclR helix-turn-helix domain-containing protein n=1 Tax=Tropicimonas isoalkanivorans TaxID=441112 RepID=A0A1I1RPQ0_9RHOB|nr:helix-turn-helix domain-containing protein [Tropicimonas isoalkanivorans]SFD36301.1 IclR helix-turn-helix domain-containing protein [Tropicimonas isoalkanivorans]